MDRYDEVNPNISYSGNWTHSAAESRYAGTESYTNTIGASANFNFVGSSLNIVCTKYNSYSATNYLYIDNVLVSTFSISGGTEFQAIVASVTGLESKEHFVSVIAGAPNFYFDAIEITSGGQLKPYVDLMLIKKTQAMSGGQ